MTTKSIAQELVVQLPSKLDIWKLAVTGESWGNFQPILILIFKLM